MKFTPMDSLPIDPCVYCLVFGRTDSGKSTFALDYATSVLRAHPGSACLVFAHKSKTMRKLVPIADASVSNRVLYRWVNDRFTLIESAARLHEYAEEPLELLIVEDLLDFVHPFQVHGTVALLINAVSVFPGCRLLVTLTPRNETAIAGFRVLMTHFVNTCGEWRKIGALPKSLAKAKEEIAESFPEEAHARDIATSGAGDMITNQRRI
jgi:hypothetical protein